MNALRPRGLAACLLPVLLAGCGMDMRPVVIAAPPAVWQQLGGEWRGEYTLNGRDRHGLIAFRLDAVEHQAAGDVLMIPDRAAWPYGPAPSGDPPNTRRGKPDSQLLTIRFVGAEAGRVRGTMDPYWDPDRECQAWASFLGSVDGEVVAGTFISVCDDGVRTLRGRWRVERRRPAGS